MIIFLKESRRTLRTLRVRHTTGPPESLYNGTDWALGCVLPLGDGGALAKLNGKGLTVLSRVVNIFMLESWVIERILCLGMIPAPTVLNDRILVNTE